MSIVKILLFYKIIYSTELIKPVYFGPSVVSTRTDDNKCLVSNNGLDVLFEECGGENELKLNLNSGFHGVMRDTKTKKCLSLKINDESREMSLILKDDECEYFNIKDNRLYIPYSQTVHLTFSKEKSPLIVQYVKDGNVLEFSQLLDLSPPVVKDFYTEDGKIIIELDIDGISGIKDALDLFVGSNLETITPKKYEVGPKLEIIGEIAKSNFLFLYFKMKDQDKKSSKLFINVNDNLEVDCPFPLINISGVCTNCIAGLHYSSRDKSCHLCNEGKQFVLSDDSCLLCRKDDVYNIFMEGCRECKENEFLNEEKSRCTLCPVDKIYDSEKKTCKACEDGLFATPDGCTKCPKGHINKNGNCVKCEKNNRVANNTCVPCLNDHVLDEAIQECIRCPEGLIPNLGECVKCPEGNVFDESFNGCVKCGKGMEPNSNKDACVDCLENYVSKDGVRCVKCDNTTISNKERDECICRPGLNPLENTKGILICSKCGKNEYYDGSQCLTCEFPKVLNDDKSGCKICGRNEIVNQNEAKCELCKENTFPNKEKTLCISCKKGTERGQDNTCVPCEGNTVSENGQKCVKCEDGKFSNEDHDKCVFCKPGYELRDKACKKCEGNTVSENGQKCVKCEDGKFSNEDHDKCAFCKPGYELRDKDCKKCEGNTVSENGQKCVKCEDGKFSNEDHDKCVFCKPGYELRDKACKKCEENCVSDGVKCVKCSGKNEISNDSKDKCVCKPGFSRNSDKEECKLCNGIVANNICQQCPPYSSPNVAKNICECYDNYLMMDGVCQKCDKQSMLNKNKTECIRIEFRVSYWIYPVTILACSIIYILLLLCLRRSKDKRKSELDKKIERALDNDKKSSIKLLDTDIIVLNEKSFESLEKSGIKEEGSENDKEKSIEV